MSRLSPERLKEITDRELPAAQARWFKRHFDVAPPYDKSGVIMTEAAFEGLVAKRLGLNPKDTSRPVVKLGKKRVAVES